MSQAIVGVHTGRQSGRPSNGAMAAAAAAAAEESKGASLSAAGGYEPYDTIEAGINHMSVVVMSNYYCLNAQS